MAGSLNIMARAGLYTTVDVIESVLASFFIVDYGKVDAVNSDGTVNVRHAANGVLRYTGEELEPYVTNRVEMLTLSCAQFSVSFKPKEGDGVLLLGLKDKVSSVAEYQSGSKQVVNKNPAHYTRNTMKALPVGVFNSNSKVSLAFEDGSLALRTDGDVKLDVSEKLSFSGASQASLDVGSFSVSINGSKVLEVK